MKKITLIIAAAITVTAASAQKIKTPVMGWSSWNTLALNINAKTSAPTPTHKYRPD